MMIRVLSAYSHTEIFCGTDREVTDFMILWGLDVVAGEDDWITVA